jgi:hypothetical protein
MLDLIERLEKATGPDRDLDLAIFIAITGKVWVPSHNLASENVLEDLSEDVLIRMEREGEFREVERLLRYTASLNAALTLAPEGLVANFGNDVGPCWAAVWRDTAGYDGYPHQAQAPSMPLALCIAALRARAAHVEARS